MKILRCFICSWKSSIVCRLSRNSWIWEKFGGRCYLLVRLFGSCNFKSPRYDSLFTYPRRWKFVSCLRLIWYKTSCSSAGIFNTQSANAWLTQLKISQTSLLKCFRNDSWDDDCKKMPHPVKRDFLFTGMAKPYKWRKRASQ